MHTVLDKVANAPVGKSHHGTGPAGVPYVWFQGTGGVVDLSLPLAGPALQAWRTPYPAGVGSVLLGTRPMVHAGFHRAWFANKFNEKLIGRCAVLLSGVTSGVCSDEP